MTSKYLHEEIYRGAESVAKLAKPLVAICGAGALGSHLADNLVRQGFRNLRVIDCDRVEEHNVSTQLYGAADVGEYPLARNLVLLAVAIASEAVVRFVLDAEQESRSATLRDFAVRILEGPTK